MTEVKIKCVTLTISEGNFVALEGACGDSKYIEWSDLPNHPEVTRWTDDFLLLVAQSVSSVKKSTTSFPFNSLLCYFGSGLIGKCRCQTSAVA